MFGILEANGRGDKKALWVAVFATSIALYVASSNINMLLTVYTLCFTFTISVSGKMKMKLQSTPWSMVSTVFPWCSVSKEQTKVNNRCCQQVVWWPQVPTGLQLSIPWSCCCTYAPSREVSTNIGHVWSPLAAFSIIWNEMRWSFCGRMIIFWNFQIIERRGWLGFSIHLHKWMNDMPRTWDAGACIVFHGSCYRVALLLEWLISTTISHVLLPLLWPWYAMRKQEGWVNDP